jgi:integrase/recombinase XerD
MISTKKTVNFATIDFIVSKMEVFMKKKQPKTWVTREEYSRIINNPYLPRKDDLIIQLLYSCALRVSELVNIKVQDVDIRNSTICIWESKRSSNPALVPVPLFLTKMLNQWITDNRLSPNRYLFFSTHDKKISRSLIHRVVKEAAQRARIEKEITTHTFRRSRASHLLDAGLPIEQVSRLLRHKYLNSTMIYLKISIKGLQQAINNIDIQNNDLIF